MKNSLLLSVILFLTGPLFAEKAEVTVPARLVIDSYVHLLLDSQALQVDKSGRVLGNIKKLTPGSLYFGNQFPEKKRKRAESDIFFSFDYFTQIKVKIINNSKPFQLFVSIEPNAQAKSILDLKTSDDQSALNIKTMVNADTKYPDNLYSLNNWTSFPSIGDLVVYDSSGEVISDNFKILFSILNLAFNTKGAEYSGRIIWRLSTKI